MYEETSRTGVHFLNDPKNLKRRIGTLRSGRRKEEERKSVLKVKGSKRGRGLKQTTERIL